MRFNLWLLAVILVCHGGAHVVTGCDGKCAWVVCDRGAPKSE